MELPDKLLEQKPSNTRPKTEELMLVVVDKSTNEKNYLNHHELVINNLK